MKAQPEGVQVAAPDYMAGLDMAAGVAAPAVVAGCRFSLTSLVLVQSWPLLYGGDGV